MTPVSADFECLFIYRSEFDVGLIQILTFQEQEELVSQWECFGTRCNSPISALQKGVTQISVKNKYVK